MHGLTNRAIQCFVRDTYGAATWRDVAAEADLGPHGFEAMLRYDDEVTWRVLALVCERLAKPEDAVLEDLGTYLVSHPNVEALRRLLRFGGVDFVDFLHSLDDLSDRARLAVPDLALPPIEVEADSDERFRLRCRAPRPGFGHVLVGALRAMADDYGALAIIEHGGTEHGGTEHGGGPDGREEVGVDLMLAGFTDGRDFELAARCA